MAYGIILAKNHGGIMNWFSILEIASITAHMAFTLLDITSIMDSMKLHAHAYISIFMSKKLIK